MEKMYIPVLKKEVSRIGLGTWAIGGWMWGGTEEKDAVSTLIRAYEKGINVIDTAPVYGFGTSEEIVGKALTQINDRENLVISTKCSLEWDNGKVFRNASASRIEKEIEDSLRRLKTDYIDVYFIHWPDTLTPFSESAETLFHLFKSGKIRSIGLSNFSISQMNFFKQTAPIHFLQPPYNLFERQIENHELQYCLEHNIFLMTYGTICRGLLSGKINRETEFHGDDLRKYDPKFQSPRFEQYLAAVIQLDQLAKQNYGKSVMTLSARWILDKGVSIALWGARKPSQLEGLDEIFGWKISSTDMEVIDRILADIVKDPVGPEFMAPTVKQEEANL